MSRIYKNKDPLYIASIFLLLLFEVLALFVIYKNMPNLLDSDMAGEMMLSKILVEEGRLFTDSWYYSTEIRTLYIHLIFMFFFLFTDNWFIVRFLSIIVLHVILISSSFYMCKQLGLKRYAPYVACMTLFAFTYYYFNYVIAAACFVPYIAIIFLTVGFICKYPSLNGKEKYIILGISLLLALLSGMNGIRQIVICYFPLFLAVVFLSILSVYNNGIEDYLKSDSFSCLKFSFLNMIANGIGYIINSKILSARYYYKTWEGIRFTFIDFDKLSDILNGVLQTFGYNAFYITLLSLLNNVVCLLILLVLIYSLVRGLRKEADDRYKALSLFFVFDFLLFVAIYVASNMHYSPAYNVPILILAYPLMAYGIKEADLGKAPKASKGVIAVLIILVMAASSLLSYREYVRRNDNEELIKIADYVDKEGCEAGYATFWNADIIVELTNGNVDMYSWIDSRDGSKMSEIESVDDLYEWLQKRDHFKNPPEGKIFMIYHTNEIPYCNWKEQLNKKDLIFQTDHYQVYGYDSYALMKQKLETK